MYQHLEVEFMDSSTPPRKKSFVPDRRVTTHQKETLFHGGRWLGYRVDALGVSCVDDGEGCCCGGCKLYCKVESR